MRVPPPLLFLLTFIAGTALQHLVPLTIPSVGMVRGSCIVGVGLAGCGVLLALSSVGIFLAARTTVVPFAAASKLVTWGPYRFTRNPMYVSLVLTYVGVAVMLSWIWPLFLSPLPVFTLHGIVIPFEEKQLRETFGETYDRYCARVRRWL
jgi:protein-S-isoprenylcysteine O-methyltransferase Ste14